jgi:hypothetical protein
MEEKGEYLMNLYLSKESAQIFTIRWWQVPKVLWYMLKTELL